MRKTALLFAGLVFAAGFTACNNNAADKISGDAETSATDNKTEVSADLVDNTAGTPVFEFEEEVFDFGEIEEGTVAKHNFVFKNTGDAPLIITSANGSCGCTVPNPPKEPIAPGATAEIKVSFNSNGRSGNQQKTVTINANTIPATKILRISAQVQPKDGAEAATPAANG
jgi:hypothetical protein